MKITVKLKLRLNLGVARPWQAQVKVWRDEMRGHFNARYIGHTIERACVRIYTRTYVCREKRRR